MNKILFESGKKQWKPKKMSFFDKIMPGSPKNLAYTRDEWLIILDSHGLLYPIEIYRESTRQKAPI